jgi:hypothetical protein
MTTPKTIAGLTPAQAKAVEAMTRLADASWHDGLIDAVARALPGDGPPWGNLVVQRAIDRALADHGIDSPMLP